jgi:hypothetical protein
MSDRHLSDYPARAVSGGVSLPIIIVIGRQLKNPDPATGQIMGAKIRARHAREEAGKAVRALCRRL